MATSNQTVGVVEAIWKNKKLPLKAGASFTPGGLKNTPVIFGKKTLRTMEGFSSNLKGTIPFRKGDVLSDLIGDMSEGELQIIADTGQRFIVPDAFLHEPSGFTGGDGRPMEWSGSEADEVG